MNDQVKNANFHLFKPIDSYRMGYSSWGSSGNAGKNHHNGVKVFFNINQSLINDSASVSLEFFDSDKKLIKKISSDDKKNKLVLNGKKNSFVWNMRYDDAKGFDGLIMWAASLRGPKAAPGEYFVKLNVNSESMETNFTILKDPRSLSSNSDLKEQFGFLISIRDKINTIHKSIEEIRSTRNQLNDLKNKLDENHTEINVMIDEINTKISKIEKELYQTKNRSGQDPLNFPIRLNNKLAHLTSVASVGNFKPTDQMYGVRDELLILIDKELESWESIKSIDLEQLNTTIIKNNIQLISIN